MMDILSNVNKEISHYDDAIDIILNFIHSSATLVQSLLYFDYQ